jgi:hypothetical protein
MKRTLAALKKNLETYEKDIAPISEAPEPNSKGSIEFRKA